MVFVDTSFLVAAVSHRDGHHADALALRPLAMEAGLWTTNYVVGESWTFALRRYGRHVALNVLRAVRESQRHVVAHVSHETEEDAFAWLLRHDEREYSFVDAVSFAVMREHGIDTALAFDRDFEAAGFRTLRA